MIRGTVTVLCFLACTSRRHLKVARKEGRTIVVSWRHAKDPAVFLKPPA